MAHGDSIFAQVGPKIVIFKRFQQNFFGTARFQLKFLMLIESPNILHRKPAKQIKACVCGLGTVVLAGNDTFLTKNTT